MFLTYRYRLKDGKASARAALRKQASAVNYVWNYCCEIQREAERRWKAGAAPEHCRWPSHFDLTYLTAGAGRELGLNAMTVAAICREFARSRSAYRRCPGWRSGRRSLPWVPSGNAHEAVAFKDGSVRFRKRWYRLWWTRDLPDDAKIKTASFAADARGRWYFNVTFETEEVRPHGAGEIGVDLGLKSFAVTSDGAVIPNLRHAERYAAKLATAQRARNKKRVAAIHAKIANARKDQLHKVSTRLMRANRRIIVGDVSASSLAKTKLAKSVLDAGWSSFRSFLAYKAIAHQVEYLEVNEAYTSRTCSACGCIPASSPKGMGALGMRSWKCDECGEVHDRDLNAARNILRIGAARRPPAEAIAA